MDLALLTNLSNYTTYNNADAGSNMFVSLVWLALAVFMIAAMWGVFVKAKKPGWAAIIPFYNTYVTLKIVGRPGWWLVFYFIPIVNIVVHVIVMNDLAKAFAKGVGYTLLLLFIPFIGWPLLAWGDATYKKAKKSKK
jgi:hypothetical protein